MEDVKKLEIGMITLMYQDEQIKELAENYDISGFWFDGFWDILKEKGSTLETRQAAEVRLESRANL